MPQGSSRGPPRNDHRGRARPHVPRSSGLAALLRARLAAGEAGMTFRVRDPSPALRRMAELGGERLILAAAALPDGRRPVRANEKLPIKLLNDRVLGAWRVPRASGGRRGHLHPGDGADVQAVGLGRGRGRRTQRPGHAGGRPRAVRSRRPLRGRGAGRRLRDPALARRPRRGLHPAGRSLDRPVPVARPPTSSDHSSSGSGARRLPRSSSSRAPASS